MSYRIEYNWAMFRIEPEHCNRSEPYFIFAAEGGDNNLIETRRNRPVRDWTVGAIGTANAVLKRAVWFSASCEGGSLKPHGRDCKPESYIRRVRELLEEPSDFRGYWYPELCVPEGHPAVALAENHGLKIRQEIFYSEKRAVATFTEAQRSLIFDFVDHYSEMAHWHFAKVGGLPRS